jgi:hypothetical protein
MAADGSSHHNFPGDSRAFGTADGQPSSKVRESPFYALISSYGLAMTDDATSRDNCKLLHVVAEFKEVGTKPAATVDWQDGLAPIRVLINNLSRITARGVDLK